jgi:hypothetical protein
MFGLNWISLAAYAAVAALLFGGGFKLAHDLDQGTIQHMKAAEAQAAADAQKQARSIEQQQAQISNLTGAAEASAQEALQARARVVTKEITHYVTAAQDARGCVTWGMLRLHDAAALGVDPASLQPPSGQSDDACSPVKPSDFAAGVAGNYAVAHENAEQLDALEADIRQRVASFNGGK